RGSSARRWALSGAARGGHGGSRWHGSGLVSRLSIAARSLSQGRRGKKAFRGESTGWAHASCCLMRTIKPRARCAPPPPCGEGLGGRAMFLRRRHRVSPAPPPLPNPPPQGGREQTECGARAFHSRESTHPGEALLLALVERVVEARERGADRGGRGAHGGQALAHRLHAADRGERGLGGAGGGERVGGFERGGDELVEG